MKVRMNDSGRISIVGSREEILDLLEYAQDGAHFSRGSALNPEARLGYEYALNEFTGLYQKVEERVARDGKRSKKADTDSGS